MNCQLLWRLLQITFFILIVTPAVFGQIAHDIKVKLDPESHRIEVVDKINLQPGSLGTEPLHFAIHQGLEPDVLDKDIVLRKTFGAEAGEFFTDNPSLQQSSMGIELFEVNLPEGIDQFTLKYAGEIYHPVEEYGEE
ncbi:MAG: hypothetical protein GY775_17420, partial [Candidatus Scalindua sp.]|nr:hypothetical protein [Candidatus Scalindua sp.]